MIMNKLEEWEQALKQAVDTGYSYGLARRMEEYKTNPVLGYRTAGSGAERETGEMLYREMEALGLSGVCRDKIQVDSWEAVIEISSLIGTSLTERLKVSISTPAWRQRFWHRSVKSS